MRQRFRTFVLGTATTLLLAGAFLVGGTARLEASECGGPGGQECKSNKSCVHFIFYSQCTTTTDYWKDSR